MDALRKRMIETGDWDRYAISPRRPRMRPCSVGLVSELKEMYGLIEIGYRGR